MLNNEIHKDDVFALVKPGVDVHTLGISIVSQLLTNVGYEVHIADAVISAALDEISKLNNIDYFENWVKTNNITCIGYSYRLDPKQAQIAFGKFYYQLENNKLLIKNGGKIKKVFFAGLPDACKLIEKEYNGEVSVFKGDETPLETLTKIGIPLYLIPTAIKEGSSYDNARFQFAQKLISDEKFLNLEPVNRSGYNTYGTVYDNIIDRINYSRIHSLPPLFRVHVGPYNPNYTEAVKEFKSWVKTLAKTGYLDIVSIGSSQLTQSNFGENWEDKPNGGGVPINSALEYREIWEAGRPMLFRTYSGTRNVPQLAQIHELSLNICWHALSFWWFCVIDGRGAYSVYENLKQHIKTLEFIAKTNKPFEPNIPHHFSFRGGDDITYVASAYIAAKTAKKYGIKTMILQNMLNTPKYTSGIQDLAKSRVMLRLVRLLEDQTFKVFFQPRAGLDYFSPDIEKAKTQLAAVTALMDDIEPENPQSPDMIHVVSYSEASHLATPEIINESIRITTQALISYRVEKKKRGFQPFYKEEDVMQREKELYVDVKQIIEAIEENVPDPYSPEGLYKIFASGFLVAPYLWEGKEEFKNAIKWQTTIKDGSVKIIDNKGKELKPAKRIPSILNDLKKIIIPTND